MRKFTIAFIAILLITNSSYGQKITDKDSTAAYEKVKKWAVVKLTIAYMEDLRGWSSETKKVDVKENLGDELDDYIELDSRYKDFSESIDIDEFSSKLNGHWSGTKDAVFEKYKAELYDSISTNNFKNIRIQAQNQSIQEMDAIYDEFKKITNESDETINKLREFELTTEMENTIPIVSNGFTTSSAISLNTIAGAGAGAGGACYEQLVIG